MPSTAQESSSSASDTSDIIFQDKYGHVLVKKISGVFSRARGPKKSDKMYSLVEKKIIVTKYEKQNCFEQYIVDESQYTQERLGYCELHFEDKETAILTMPLIEGETLAALVKKQREKNEDIDDTKACLIVSTLLQELRKLQTRELVHGDLQPRNIMIKPNGKSKIFDFGDSHKKGSLVDQINWKRKKEFPHISPVCFFRQALDQDEVVEPLSENYIADYSQDLYSLRYTFQEIQAIVQEDSLFFRQLADWIDDVDDFATKQIMEEPNINADEYFKRLEMECSQMIKTLEAQSSQRVSLS